MRRVALGWRSRIGAGSGSPYGTAQAGVVFALAFVFASTLYLTGSSANARTLEKTEDWRIEGMRVAWADPAPAVRRVILEQSQWASFRLWRILKPADLVKAMKEPDPKIRGRAAQELARMAFLQPQVTMYGPQIASLLETPDTEVALQALDALRMIANHDADSGCRPLLNAAQHHPKAEVRARAIEMLMQAKGNEAYEKEVEALMDDPEVRVAAAAICSLLARKPGDAIYGERFTALLMQMKDDTNGCETAMTMLERAGTRAASLTPALERLLKSKNLALRRMALCRLADSDAAARLLPENWAIQHLVDERGVACLEVARMMIRQGQSEACTARLSELLKAGNSLVIRSALSVFRQLPPESLTPYEAVVRSLLHHPDAEVAREALGMLSMLEPNKKRLEDEMLSFLTDPRPEVVSAAVSALDLRKSREPSHATALAKLLHHADANVCNRAIWALMRSAKASSYRDEVVPLLNHADGEVVRAAYEFLDYLEESETDRLALARQLLREPKSSPTLLGIILYPLKQYGKLDQVPPETVTALLTRRDEGALLAAGFFGNVNEDWRLQARVLNRGNDAGYLLGQYVISGGSRDLLRSVYWLGGGGRPLPDPPRPMDTAEACAVLGMFYKLWIPTRDLPELRQRMYRQLSYFCAALTPEQRGMVQLLLDGFAEALKEKDCLPAPEGLREILSHQR